MIPPFIRRPPVVLTDGIQRVFVWGNACRSYAGSESQYVWVIISTDRRKTAERFLRESVFPNRLRIACGFCPGNESKTPPEILAYGRNGTVANNSVVEYPRGAESISRRSGLRGLTAKGEGLFDKMNRASGRMSKVSKRHSTNNAGATAAKSIEAVCGPTATECWNLKERKRFRYGADFQDSGEARRPQSEHPHSQLIGAAHRCRAACARSGQLLSLLRRKSAAFSATIIRQEPTRRNGDRRKRSLHHAAPMRPRFRLKCGCCRTSTVPLMRTTIAAMYSALGHMLEDTSDAHDAG